MHIVRAGTFGAGMEAGIVNVSTRLPEDFRVSLCALAPLQTFSDFLKRPGTQFFTLPPRRPDGVDWMLVPRLARLFRQAEVDLVHSHTWGTFLYSVLAARLSGTAITHGEYGKHSFERTEHNPARGRRADQKYQLTQFFHVSPDCPLSLALRGSVSTKEPHRPMPNVIITCQDQRHERCASHDASDRQTQDRRFQGPTRRYHHQRLEDRIARFSGGHNGSMAVQVEPAGRTIRSNRAAGSQQSWRPPRFRWPELWAGCTIPRSV